MNIDPTPESKIFIDRNLKMTKIIADALDKKEKSMKDFAKENELQEERFLNFMTGICDYSLREISKIEAALNIKILE